MSLRWQVLVVAGTLGVASFPLKVVADGAAKNAADGAAKTPEDSSADPSPEASDEASDSVSSAEEQPGPPEQHWFDKIWANYYGIYYGSSVIGPSLYQSGPYEQRDTTRPVLFKNFLTTGYDLSERYSVAATGYFVYLPGPGPQFAWQDPSVRFACNSIVQFGGFNWYGDARVHFPVSTVSRYNDLLWGTQTFHFLSFHRDESNWIAGTYASLRYNHFGGQGYGDDLELYFAPMFNYDLNRRLALTFLYEMGASHTYGEQVGVLDSDGSDFQPGVLWRITPGLEFNPYLNFPTSGRVGLDMTSIGATLSWMVL